MCMNRLNIRLPFYLAPKPITHSLALFKIQSSVISENQGKERGKWYNDFQGIVTALLKRSQRNSSRNLWNSDTGCVRSGHVLGIVERGLITRVCHVPISFFLFFSDS